HTRFSRDWSSDVCSSDLVVRHGDIGIQLRVGPVNRLQIGVRELSRADFLRFQLRAGFRYRQRRQIGHDESFFSRIIRVRLRMPYSTTLGTRKKLSSVAGALATMSSALSPSVTTSWRLFISIGITDVIGSTPVTSTSFSCSTKPRMVLR